MAASARNKKGYRELTFKETHALYKLTKSEYLEVVPEGLIIAPGMKLSALKSYIDKFLKVYPGAVLHTGENECQLLDFRVR